MKRRSRRKSAKKAILRLRNITGNEEFVFKPGYLEEIDSKIHGAGLKTTKKIKREEYIGSPILAPDIDIFYEYKGIPRNKRNLVIINPLFDVNISKLSDLTKKRGDPFTRFDIAFLQKNPSIFYLLKKKPKLNKMDRAFRNKYKSILRKVEKNPERQVKYIYFGEFYSKINHQWGYYYKGAPTLFDNFSNVDFSLMNVTSNRLIKPGTELAFDYEVDYFFNQVFGYDIERLDKPTRDFFTYFLMLAFPNLKLNLEDMNNQGGRYKRGLGFLKTMVASGVMDNRIHQLEKNATGYKEYNEYLDLLRYIINAFFLLAKNYTFDYDYRYIKKIPKTRKKKTFPKKKKKKILKTKKFKQRKKIKKKKNKI